MSGRISCVEARDSDITKMFSLRSTSLAGNWSGILIGTAFSLSINLDV
ncbi:Uncharacterised protein [Vibrio cholerae]|nr:Uncharacterised protein [Vibrio cholerae]CSI76532.1 Uncharacterised protein [Vibrio cholerae]